MLLPIFGLITTNVALGYSRIVRRPKGVAAGWNGGQRGGRDMSAASKALVSAIGVIVWISVASAAETDARPAAPSPIVVYKSKFPIGVGSGEYELLSVIQDFSPGVGVAAHKHGGYVLVTVLSGEITLRQKGGERVVKTGESWTENPGDVHSVVNAGTGTTRVAISVLLPKGAELTTIVK